MFDVTTTPILQLDPVTTAGELAPILKVLADDNRLAILLLLVERPRTVVELSRELGIRQTLVSHHLKTLRDTAIVVATPEGRSNRYSVCCDALAEPIRTLTRIVTSPASS